MADGLDLKIKGGDTLFTFLSQSTQRQLIRRATNKVGKLCFTESKRVIREKYNIKLKDLNDKLKYSQPSDMTLTARIAAPTKRLTLMRFSAKQTAQGVRVQVIRGSTKTVKSAFIAQPRGINYKHSGQKKTVSLSEPFVFKRVGKSAYPIEAEKTLSVGKMLDNKKVEEQLTTIMQDRGADLLEHEMKFYFQKGIGKAVE
jgi:hypothetical protein